MASTKTAATDERAELRRLIVKVGTDAAKQVLAEVEQQDFDMLTNSIAERLNRISQVYSCADCKHGQIMHTGKDGACTARRTSGRCSCKQYVGV